MPGFASLTPSPRYGGGTPSGGGGGYQGGMRENAGQTIRQAATSARDAMSTMGVPNWGEFMKQFGGTQEFGNAGSASGAAGFERGQLEDWRGNLAGLKGEIDARKAQGLGSNRFAGQLKADQEEYAHPTQSAAFQAAMGLSGARTGRASSEAQRQSMEGQARRGYFGGYDPRQSDIDRMQALSEAGFAGVKDIREQALSKYGTDVGGYGQQNAANQAKYGTDIGALTDLYKSGMAGYQSANQGFADLTKTFAELPTKYLQAAGGFGGGPESFFSDALGAYRGAQSFNQQQRAQDYTQGQRAGLTGGTRQ